LGYNFGENKKETVGAVAVGGTAVAMRHVPLWRNPDGMVRPEVYCSAPYLRHPVVWASRDWRRYRTVEHWHGSLHFRASYIPGRVPSVQGPDNTRLLPSRKPVTTGSGLRLLPHRGDSIYRSRSPALSRFLPYITCIQPSSYSRQRARHHYLMPPGSRRPRVEPIHASKSSSLNGFVR